MYSTRHRARGGRSFLSLCTSECGAPGQIQTTVKCEPLIRRLKTTAIFQKRLMPNSHLHLCHRGKTAPPPGDLRAKTIRLGIDQNLQREDLAALQACCLPYTNYCTKCQCNRAACHHTPIIAPMPPTNANVNSNSNGTAGR